MFSGGVEMMYWVKMGKVLSLFKICGKLLVARGQQQEPANSALLSTFPIGTNFTCHFLLFKSNAFLLTAMDFGKFLASKNSIQITQM